MERQQRDTGDAMSLFAELQDCGRQGAGVRQAYLLLNRAFQRCLNENTRVPGVRFNGPFAKTDYLLKEHHAPTALQHRVNDTRVRLRDYRKRSDAELTASFRRDLVTVSQFVGLVYDVPVPDTLSANYNNVRAKSPAADTTLPPAIRQRGYLRIIVNRWDDRYLYADADAGDTMEVQVFYGGKSDHAVYKDWDWSYLGALLKEGCQLNIIRPREHDGVLYPELFVWEPDYLVDISAVANSYEHYAASPLNHLLARLKPAANTQAIVLGNLASQFLDEALYQFPAESPYSQSAQAFFRDNAVGLLTARLDDDFHEQARSQRRHISDTLHSKLPTLLQDDGLRFDSSQMMVEPSFFSEMLGLQGRMDFLQLGYKVLIEQKSGKAGFPETNPPRQQDKHYIQLLLYMLLIRYNFRDTYTLNNRELHAFLLYSKYADGLLPLGFAPSLVFAAMRLRNEIAAAEYRYTTDGLAVLEHLRADDLNTNHVQGALWERYQRPQLDQLLTPVRQATPLERAYYLRFLRFIVTEHLMAKVGGQTKEQSGFADKWHSSLEDKLLAGNIYHDMELLSPDATVTGKVEQVMLGFNGKPDHEVSNFRPGDIVVFYPYADGDEPDVRRTMVFRATIARIAPDHLLLNLRAAQSGAAAFWYQGRRRWAVEHDFFESSFGSLYRGLHAFLSAPRERRDLLLLQRAPRTDRSVTLRGDYGDFNRLALRVKQARELFLIIGPPGTGKTSYGLMDTLREELLSTDEPVLLLSYTNRAVDEICGKLVESGVDFIRVGGRFTCEERYRHHLLDSIVEHCDNIGQLRAVISRTRIFVGTTTAYNANIHLLQLKQFGLAIIDEASQILEPHLLGLLSATTADGTCAIRKMVMIGDHKQLPAVVQQNEQESAVSDPLLHAIHLTNCRLSLFERLLRQYRDDPRVTHMLTRQGRMHRDIARFPSHAFYHDLLQEVPLPHQLAPLPAEGHSDNGIDNLLLTRRMAFIPVSADADSPSDKVNSREAQAIAATLARIYRLHADHFDPLQTVGVIVPYRNQIAEIRRCVERYAIAPLSDITIDTVERYQGSQRDIILYGFTIRRRHQLSFLTDHVFVEDGATIDRKLNVAMTRARQHLLLFGDPQLLRANATFSRLLDFIRQQQGYVDVSLDDYTAGRFVLPAAATPET